MGVGGVMALKVTGIVAITEIAQKTSAPSQISLEAALVLFEIKKNPQVMVV